MDAYDSSASSIFSGEVSDLTDEDDKDKVRPQISIFAPDVVIKNDAQAYKYCVTDNRSLKPVSLVRTLQKGGRYIINIGAVNLFEMMILNMFLVVYSY